ncbi:MAG: hypothetical protein ACK5UQ_03195, partial [Planctomycetota bacterium]
MAKPNPKKKRRIWRTLAITVGALAVLLFLFVATFVFNPFEGRVLELRDVVPRGVNFFVHKQRLVDDFDPFPQPRFWSDLTSAPGWRDLQASTLGQSWQRHGADRAVQQVVAALEQVKTDSSGFLDVLRDAFGEEVIVAGYEQDYTQQPPRPLAQPWWCVYTRVSWKVKAGYGLFGLGFLDGALKQQGIETSKDGELFVLKVPGATGPLYVRRYLDLLMVGNNKLLLEQSQR